MNLEPAPRVNKTAFFAVAAVCFAVVVLIGLFAPNRFSSLPLLCAVGFLILSITAFMFPFLVDLVANHADHEQKERVRVADQVQRLQAASDSLARAAAQIKAVEEAVHKTAHAAENLPYRMQEKLAEFNEALAGKEEEDREALEQELTELRAANSEQLKAVAEKIHKAATDWAALETATRKQLTAAEAALARIQGAAGDTAVKFEARLAATLATLDTKLATLETAGPATGRSTPPLEPATDAFEEKRTGPESVVESVAVVDTGSNPAEPASHTSAEEPKARKPRAPRKPKPEDTAPAAGTGEAAFPDSPGESTSTSARVDESATSVAPTETAASSDGATRLLATAYIGIGNKLFIRGEGPGLSWERGVPMQFVSIGKWGWATNDAAAIVRCKLYKNDETAAVSGEVVLEPGKHVEVTALF